MKIEFRIWLAVVFMTVCPKAWAESRVTGSDSATTSAQRDTADDLDFIDENDLPLYIITKTSLAVPADADHDVLSAGAGFGVVFNSKPDAGDDEWMSEWGHHLGMRFIWVPEPPENPLASRHPDIDQAWGPVVDWQAFSSPRSRVSFFTNVSVGYVYGVPNDAGKKDIMARYQEKARNVILPIVEGGFGIRLLSRRLSGGNTRAFVAPEIGMVPGAEAPYAALSVGLL